MVARRMAEERLFAVITSNSSHSVQKSCCVIATSSSTMRTLGFVIIFFPVTNQNRAGGALHLHLCSIPFRRMPGIRELHTRFYGNARASRGAHRRTRLSRRKRGGDSFDETQGVHRSGQGRRPRCVHL